MKAFALAAVALLAATQAQAADRFRQAGYVVDSWKTGETLQLSGVNPQTKARFRVSVDADNRVTGVWNGERVNFVAGEKVKVQTADISGH